MKIVYGEHEHKITWRDGCVAGGGVLMLGGLCASFGFGIVVAIAGAVVASVPFLRLERPT